MTPWWLAQCVRKNIRGGMKRDQAVRMCSGAWRSDDTGQQVSTTRRPGPLPGAAADQVGSPAASMSSAPTMGTLLAPGSVSAITPGTGNGNATTARHGMVGTSSGRFIGAVFNSKTVFRSALAAAKDLLG